MKTQIIFDATTGKEKRRFSTTLEDVLEVGPDEVSYIETDPAIIEHIMRNDVELQNGQLIFTPKAQLGLDELKQRKLAIFKSQVAPAVVFKMAPDYKQRNVGMGIYDAATSTAIKNWVVAVRTGVDEVEAQLLAATDEVTLEAIDISAESLEVRAQAIFATL